MATNGDFISSSLRLLGVLMETESASAEQGATGLVALNDLMADLSASDIDLGYAPQSDPTANCPISIEYRQSVKYLLAVLLAPIYTRPVGPVVAAFAEAGKNKLLRDAINRNLTPVRTDLPRSEARRYGYNILTDT